MADMSIIEVFLFEKGAEFSNYGGYFSILRLNVDFLSKLNFSSNFGIHSADNMYRSSSAELKARFFILKTLRTIIVVLTSRG